MTETYVVQLPEFLHNCPKWWRNFINSNPKDFDGALAEMGARWVEEEEIWDDNESGYHSEQWVEFESHQCYVMFLLRWQ